MFRLFPLAFLLLVAGCSGGAPRQASPSACGAGEASHACQIERYHNVAAQ